MPGRAPQATQTNAGPIYESKATKPICVSEAVPVGDCIPQRFANLPPDPGPDGMKTLESVDCMQTKTVCATTCSASSCSTGAILTRAVTALKLIAKNAQRSIELGDSVSRDQAYEIAKEMNNRMDVLLLTFG